ncbi:MAG TPA: serine/threonine-protein kinase [Polyangiaceae bacterium]|nr:serine/threonine-protein kinase [Polyangiaceae bacterium]
MAQQQQRYKVLEKIASGGMAEVFRAESAGLEGFKKTVAIKRVLPHLSEKKQFIGMFLDEARVSAQLSHSNCVQVFDIGVGDNTYFIVMEYVDGADLKGVIEHRKKSGTPFPVEEACLICVRICEGLSYAHELTDNSGESLHIVHRDMSPPNVLITRFGEVKIVDFGLAKANSQLEKSEPGIIKGKFSYLSPEAAQGLPVDAKTDIFAVGIILWELLAGRRLFMGETDLETVRMVQQARVPSIRQINPKVSPELERVIMRALVGDPAARYQTARDFGRDLNNMLFHMGRAVSSFDIAQLVEPIRLEREDKKRHQKYDRRSIIGSLIDEALFEFTSLEEQEAAAAGRASGLLSSPGHGAAPLQIGSFAGVPSWGEDLGGLGLETARAAPSGDSFDFGNLAALEDDPLGGRVRSEFPAAAGSSRPPMPRSAPPMGVAPVASRPLPIPQLPPQPQQPKPRPQQLPVSAGHTVADLSPDVEYPSGKSKRGVIAVIVVLVAVVGAAGAYFGGVIPH